MPRQHFARPFCDFENSADVDEYKRAVGLHTPVYGVFSLNGLFTPVTKHTRADRLTTYAYGRTFPPAHHVFDVMSMRFIEANEQPVVSAAGG